MTRIFNYMYILIACVNVDAPSWKIFIIWARFLFAASTNINKGKFTHAVSHIINYMEHSMRKWALWIDIWGSAREIRAYVGF